MVLLREVTYPGSIGTLERLIALETSEFDSAPNSCDYVQSTLLVRYLLFGPEFEPRLQKWLSVNPAG